MAYLPTNVKVWLSRLHGGWNITSWKHTEEENQTQQQNLKTLIKKVQFTPAECFHSMLVMSHPMKTCWEPSLVAGPKKHKSTLLISIFTCILGKRNFSKPWALAFNYKVITWYIFITVIKLFDVSVFVASIGPGLKTSFMTSVAPRVSGTMLNTQEVFKCVFTDLKMHVHNLIQYSTCKALRI